MNEGGNDLLRLAIEVKKGVEQERLVKTLAAKVKETFELAPQIVVLETGTLAKEFEANVKAARFVDRRG